MGGKDGVTLGSSFRLSPVQMCLFTLGPLVLAGTQLANSYVTGLPLHASIPFALVMVSYAVLHTRHHLAHLRLRELEREVMVVTAD